MAIPLLVATALAASLAGLGNEFVQDDFRLIETNARVHGLGQLGEILSKPYWPPPWHEELYRPLLTVFHAVQYTLGGGGPLLFRLASYLLYAATAVAVYRLGVRLLPAAIALAMGVLFAAHPVHVEAVALAVGQGELIVALLAIVMTQRYLEHRRRGPLPARAWTGLIALYLAASLTKEQGLLIPALLLAAECTLIQGPVRERVRSLTPGYSALALIALAVVLLRRAVLGGEFSGVFVAEALQGATPGARVLTFLQIVPQWARLLLWPVHLQSDYAPQELVASTGFGAAEGLGALLVLGIVGAAWAARRRAPAVTFGILWLAITLFPVSNLVTPTGFLLAERTLFLPSVGLVLAAGGALELGLAASRRRAEAGAGRELLLAGVLLALLGIARSAERQRVWRSEAFFTVRTVQDAPRSYRAQRAYGEVLFLLERNDLALEAYERARTLAPAGQAWRVRNDLARRFRAMGLTEREVEELRASLRELPEQEDTRGYLIAAYLLLGRYGEAAAEVDTALARGGRAEVFGPLRALADSATRAGAPPGSIRLRAVTEPKR